MDNITFQKIFDDSFSNLGFRRYKKNYFYYADEKLIMAINKQKSYYDNSYYINFGFWVKSLHGDLGSNPKIQECDMVNRFICECQGMKRGDFPLDMLEASEVRKCFEDNIARRIIPVLNEGIEKYFALYPNAICTARVALRDYLGC